MFVRACMFSSLKLFKISFKQTPNIKESQELKEFDQENH